MELLECLNILKKEARLFWFIVLSCVFLSLLWQQSQAPRFEATQLLNVGRTGVQATPEYAYDSFYRLQADERFADTVIRWLGSPRVVEDIYREADLNPEELAARDLKRAFAAGRLSSQVIEVRYQKESRPVLNRLSVAIPVVLNQYTEGLNQEFHEQNWFTVVSSEPVVRDARVALWPTLAVALLSGLFIAFWTALLRHYLTENKQPTTNNQQQK